MDEQIIQQALLIKDAEDDELRKLLKKMHIKHVDQVIDYINSITDDLDDILQADYEEILAIAERAYKKSDTTAPLAIWLALQMRHRTFIKDFNITITPRLKSMYQDLGQQAATEYDTSLDFDKKTSYTAQRMSKWLKQLSKLMNLTTRNFATSAIKRSYERGKGIDWLRTKLSQSDEFSYRRARTTAITEGMRMYSAGTYEAMEKSNVVIGFEWHHANGVREPRKSHEDLEGTVIDKESYFHIDGEFAKFPRDPDLSAKQSVNCHCYIEPVLAGELKGGE
ncbi:phage minor head protein [Loigolactobacillus zhaoyuanensis]|uniref:phage minor head protein n=1 Tax=Loigolactobacillus zhaoyuanensis TaxID=2486017 RepID=UPI0013DD8DD7|nr:phage minor head protein [Loigolactobacillus zhaoyuanensis]